MPPVYEAVTSVMTSHFNIPEDTIRPEATLEDLGLDSLAVVELLCVLQDELGLRVPTGDDALKSLQITLAQAAAAVDQAQPAGASETLA
ncbi:acyl carrier protein [Streptomyces sp. CB02923]|uniref:acyl carrier protein n=1 Tax=Streptomyces sp. CB02923 TaxID=1718985 RepID=UPI00093CDDB1|nr:phosphopantetheine-binding protein [Streptomyces sp. CB02923]OKH99314.1 acyl carrier protein [Streptomyces sp. CB02923]